ncbi:uroporphyrinogen-III synthase [Prochlorococcus marinus]|uniref:uroporphyrinogen-III synthase n=1 Tax=Prochlorococcus marinus TaxID=1219 RepID=UPI0022B56F29|nr:uroporphyrinogen-III synthase [Prochlorococcus marinus]
MNTESDLPLTGKTIVITRSQDQQAEARTLFEEKGARVLDLPALIIGPPDNWGFLDNALFELTDFHWIIFSSSNGITAVEKRLQLLGKSLANRPRNLKIACVGRKTAKKLESLNLSPDFVPPEFVAESLIEHFPVSGLGLKILIPRVQSGGRTLLAKAFAEAGSNVVEVPAYESKCPLNIPKGTVLALQNGEVHGIVFTSAKTAAHTSQLMNNSFGENWLDILSGVKIISIGPQTSIGCKKYFYRIDQEAQEYNLEGLVLAAVQSMKNK